MEGRYFLTMLVGSSVLHYAAYWTEGGILELGFHHGKTYRYYNVPLQVAVNRVVAPSAGVYYNRYIKSEFQPEDSVPPGPGRWEVLGR